MTADNPASVTSRAGGFSPGVFGSGERRNEMGASLSATGLSPTVEPVPVSPAVAASIPSAGALIYALAKRDKVARECPIDHPRLHARPHEDRFQNCVKCGSGPSGPCWVKVRADGEFVDDMRAIASAMSAGTAETPAAAQGEARQRDPQGDAQIPQGNQSHD